MVVANNVHILAHAKGIQVARDPQRVPFQRRDARGLPVPTMAFHLFNPNYFLPYQPVPVHIAENKTMGIGGH